MWELFMESEYPSTNDIVATPIGGMALGETFYRTSDLILDDRAVGSERVGREIAAFIVSPMRGLTRILNGDAWKHRSSSGRQFGIPDVCIAISVGMRALEFKDDIFDRGLGIASEIAVEYGDRFITLSTCSTEFESSRFVIVARELREGESAEVDTSTAKVNDNPLYPEIIYKYQGGSYRE